MNIQYSSLPNITSIASDIPCVTYCTLAVAFCVIIVLLLNKVFKWSLVGRYFIVSVIPFFTIDLSKHICILGSSGSGKSNTARLLALKISKKYPVLILDWHGEHVGLNGFKVLIPGINFFINPIKIRSKNTVDEINLIIDIISEVFYLTDPQRYILYEALKNIIINKQEQNIYNLIKSVENYQIKSIKENEIKLAILRRLKPLSEGRLGLMLSKDIDFEKILSGNFIIDLSVFKSIYLRKLVALIILKTLYNYLMRKGPSYSTRHITIIEEASNIIPPRRLEDPPSVGERMYIELRKYGEILISIAQSPELIAPTVLENTHTFIIHRLPLFSKKLGKENIDVDSLKVFEAYLISGNRLIKYKFPRIRVNNLSVVIARNFVDNAVPVENLVQNTASGEEPKPNFCNTSTSSNLIKSQPAKNTEFTKSENMEKSLNAFSEQLRVLAERIERIERRVAANSSSFERIFSLIEVLEGRVNAIESKLARTERTLRKIVDYLEYREQLRSMRGEEV